VRLGTFPNRMGTAVAVMQHGITEVMNVTPVSAAGSRPDARYLPPARADPGTATGASRLQAADRGATSGWAACLRRGHRAHSSGATGRPRLHRVGRGRAGGGEGVGGDRRPGAGIERNEKPAPTLLTHFAREQSGLLSERSGTGNLSHVSVPRPSLVPFCVAAEAGANSHRRPRHEVLIVQLPTRGRCKSMMQQVRVCMRVTFHYRVPDATRVRLAH
jgi:hypothetical protein